MEPNRILVVDDDPNVCELVTLYLEREGYEIECVHDGQDALDAYGRRAPDLIVLDLMLPSVDGLDVCREIRKKADVPIVMLTARGDDVDRILGLELGADDYVPKPFNPRELTARVKAVLRRTHSGDHGLPSRSTLDFQDLSIDPEGRSVFLNGKEISLTPKEYDLLLHLASHEGRTFTRPDLLSSVWGYDYYGDERTVDVHVKRLRRKIEPDGHPVSYVQTVWGVGYKFQVDVSQDDA